MAKILNGASSTGTVAVAFACVASCAFTGCKQTPPPAPNVSPSMAPPEPAAPTAGTSANAALPPAVDAAVPPFPFPSADSASLPQTRDVPSKGGAAFDARQSALWQAIVDDDPDRAMPFFFPLAAYVQVKDVGDPTADWKHRLVAAYRRDIHSLHARLGNVASTATLVAFDVPEEHARWVEPGEEWNKIGYYRVFGSRLRYSVQGEEHAFEVKSLISWRGEWFVVHLSATG